MDLYQLLYFQTLAKFQNFTRAADELALTQPALSRSISKLEEELGVPLFERKIRGVILNQYGKSFLKHVNQILQEMNIAREELKDMVDPLHGTVSLAFIHTLGSRFVPNLLGLFREQFPGIKFQLTQDTTQKIMNHLESAEVDLAFCSPNEQADHINTVPIVNEELFLIVPKNHNLAHREQVSLKEVANDPFVTYKHESSIRDVIERLCRSVGFQPTISFEGVGDATIAGLVASDFGVALIPLVPGLDMTKLSVLRVSEPVCRRIIYMAWRNNVYMSPAVTQFKTFVEERSCLIESTPFHYKK
ncbi:LysR family transcriptional regulator [Aneurinibacillus terranovensis]|uniref:LysR family transcriptional regulator n=1 Tax=Aneurinibacillus terranovensis TaxID=278991 RepID=UPI00041CB749|nr:LysR family transcriptional regulator [Aneurinibacillus terranovensis]